MKLARQRVCYYKYSFQIKVSVYDNQIGMKQNSKKTKSCAKNNSVDTCLLNLLAQAAVDIQFQQNHERLEFLKTNIPSNLIKSINTRDMNKLKVVIDDAFLPNCQLRTSAVPNEVTGRDKVYRFFESYIQSCPDVVMEYVTPMVFNVRVISFICYEKGTRSNFNISDHLFDHFRYGVERTPAYLSEKRKYFYLANTGLPISFETTSYVNFILNEDMTHVEKYIHTCKEVVVDPDNLDNI